MSKSLLQHPKALDLLFSPCFELMEELEPGFITYQNASLSIDERVERTATYLAALQ
jgi:hypothetical protein